MDIIVRKTIKKDLRFLKKLTQKTILTNYRSFLDGDAVDDFINSGLADREIDAGWKQGVTALMDDKRIGYALMGEGLIREIMIDPDHQRSGLGSALLGHCQELLFHKHDEVTLTCFKENSNACDFYRKNGWQVRARKTLPDPATGLNRIVFYKEKQAMVPLPGSVSIHPGLDSGYGDNLAPGIQENQQVARVTGVRKNLFLVNDGRNERLVGTLGRFHHKTDENTLFPATGDWVALENGRIASVLPRKNALSRGASGQQGKKDGTAVRNQVIAANLDSVFIVCGLDRDFNIRRIERYLTLVYNCGCNPVVILNKSDLHDSPEPFVREVQSVSFGVPVHPVSAVTKTGTEALATYLAPGKTAALLGSSGAGKSTLVNLLAGEEIQATQEVSRQVGKGVHTTTTRDLIVLPGGGLLIDNPGIREIAFWDVNDGTDSAFPEIEAWAADCRFSDCTHTGEPGCRIHEACEAGELKQERLESYLKQMRELDYLAQRKDKSADRVEKERWKWVALAVKDMKKNNKMRN